VTLGQIRWFNATLAARRRRWGGGIPTLVFVHIPLHELSAAWRAREGCFGQREEPVTPTLQNNGLFQALAAAPEVLAVFSGHDHCDDFCCSLPRSSTQARLPLCFGRHSGRGGYNCDNYANGARVVEVVLRPHGQPPRVTTYVRLALSLESFDTEIVHPGILQP
jgi:hypothetical protein